MLRELFAAPPAQAQSGDLIGRIVGKPDGAGQGESGSSFVGQASPDHAESSAGCRAPTRGGPSRSSRQAMPDLPDLDAAASRCRNLGQIPVRRIRPPFLREERIRLTRYRGSIESTMHATTELTPG